MVLVTRESGRICRYSARHRSWAQGRRVTVLVETTMSSLPPELFDLVVDHLDDEPATLKTCCVVSKSWIPRARKHLFACVEFQASRAHIALWKKAFPDPSNSPAHHTRNLSVYGFQTITAADAGAGGWIRTFCNVVHLELARMNRPSLLPFCGLLTTVRSLSLIHTPIEVFDLVCSFPLLENLTLVALFPTSDEDGWNAPMTPPKLTGTLDLKMFGKARPVAHKLLDLPGGLHFSEINATFFDDDAKSVTDLVSGCSETLESLTVTYQSAFPIPLL